MSLLGVTSSQAYRLHSSTEAPAGEQASLNPKGMSSGICCPPPSALDLMRDPGDTCDFTRHDIKSRPGGPLSPGPS